jgi:subtilisin family serine protease
VGGSRGREGRGRHLLSRAAAIAVLLAGAARAAVLSPVVRKLDSRLIAPAVVAPAVSSLVPCATQDVNGKTRVYIRLTATDDDTLAALRAAGAEIEIVDAETNRVQALLDRRRAPELAALPAVVAVRPVEPGRTVTGSVTSEGDVDSRANLVRGLGYDGSGVVVGIVSDGIDHLAKSQSTGDLGTVTVPADPRCAAGSGDEGTAILEIVHDLAPGAPLLFSSGLTSSLGFIRSVQCLASAGAAVIADDLLFFDEPYFQDGPIATAIRAVVAGGVSYHSAAGNSAMIHVEQPYLAIPGTGYHDFGGDDDTDGLFVPPGQQVVCVLQWNDPFGASANNYDLELRDGSNNLISLSNTVQDGLQDPLEVVCAANPTASFKQANVKIQKMSGADRMLDMFCFNAVGQEHVTATGSIFGHQAVSEVIAVAAIDVSDPGLVDVEPYSSNGPATIFFPAPMTRPKPDIAAFDGVSISNAGGFPPGCPPDCKFFGTSAAAPHSAAVAALLLDKNPFLLPSEIASTLRTTAVDIGPPGADNASGAGRIDALAAANAVPVPECFTSSTCDDGNPCTTDGCVRGRCAHVPVPCDDGNACNGTETCNTANGQCLPGQPLDCVDGDPCTSDTCDPAKGCVFVDIPGIDFVSCALENHLAPLIPSPDRNLSPRAARAARVLLAKLGLAEHKVSLARSAKPRQARKRLAAAKRLVSGMGTLAHRRTRDLGSAVADPIVSETGVIANKVLDVQQSL